MVIPDHLEPAAVINDDDRILAVNRAASIEKKVDIDQPSFFPGLRYTLMRKIRKLPSDHGGDVPALALTAYARPEDRARAMTAGFQHYVAKPVEPDELAAVVANLTGQLEL